MFDVNSFDFDTPLDVIVCMNNEFILQNFAINLIDVNDKIYKKSEAKVTGILLEKSKKKYYNMDIDIVIKALIVTFEELLKDKNKLAKISLMFMQESNAKFRNLRFLIDYFSFVELCGNTDKTYLYSPLLCHSKATDNYLILNVIGFSRSKIIELILDKGILKTLDENSSMEIDVIAYGGKIKSMTVEKNISLHRIFETKDFILKI